MCQYMYNIWSPLYSTAYRTYETMLSAQYVKSRRAKGPFAIWKLYAALARLRARLPGALPLLPEILHSRRKDFFAPLRDLFVDPSLADAFHKFLHNRLDLLPN